MMDVSSVFFWFVVHLQSVIVSVNGITELDAFQKFDYQSLVSRGMIKDTFTEDEAYFHYIPGHKFSDEIYLGARDRLFSVPVPDVSAARLVVKWKSNGCPRNGYTCPLNNNKQVPKRFACGNHIRLVLAHSDSNPSDMSKDGSGERGPKQLTVCGSNGGDPMCQVYRQNTPHWIVTTSNIRGNGAVSGLLCPGEKNPFYFDESSRRLFVSTKTFNYPSLVSFNVTDTVSVNLHLRQTPFFYGRLDTVTFHSMFRRGDKVYILFNEEAYESGYNSQSVYSRDIKRKLHPRKKRFARVARVCLGDEGSDSRRRDRYYFSTFFKARLLCRSPGGFAFDYLVAVSAVDTSQPDPIIRAVFAADDGLTRAHGVCAFRLSDVERGITSSEFLSFHHRASGNFLARRPFPMKKSTFLGLHLLDCRPGRTSSSVASFAHQNPLLTNPVLNKASYPWRAFTANTYNVTAMDSDTTTGREVLFLGTDGGRLLKLANMPLRDGQTRLDFDVVESLQLFPRGVAIKSVLVRRQHVVAISDHEVRTVALHRCFVRRSCHDCVRLRDPYCSWNALTQRCSASAKRFPSIESGMEHCSSVETIESPKTVPSRRKSPIVAAPSNSSGSSSNKGGSSTAGIVGFIGALVGFAVGCVMGYLVSSRCERVTAFVRRKQRSLGNEKLSPGPKRNVNLYKLTSTNDLSNSNEYDDFLDHRSPPASAPLDKKLNNEVIKNNLLASLNHTKSIENFL